MKAPNVGFSWSYVSWRQFIIYIYIQGLQLHCVLKLIFLPPSKACLGIMNQFKVITQGSRNHNIRLYMKSNFVFIELYLKSIFYLLPFPIISEQIRIYVFLIVRNRRFFAKPCMLHMQKLKSYMLFRQFNEQALRQGHVRVINFVAFFL